MQPADDDEVWEAGGSGGSADAVGEQDAGGAQTGKTPPRSCIRQGNQTVGCTLTCVCVCVCTAVCKCLFAFVCTCFRGEHTSKDMDEWKLLGLL